MMRMKNQENAPRIFRWHITFNLKQKDSLLPQLFLTPQYSNFNLVQKLRNVFSKKFLVKFVENFKKYILKFVFKARKTSKNAF
jgi:hypothetical protein